MKSALCDPAELPECATEDLPEHHRVNGFCERCQAVQDLICPRCRSAAVRGDAQPPGSANAALAARYRQLLLHAQQQKNTKFYLACILIATGDPASEGIDMTSFAREWKVTKAKVSQCCVFICKYLGTKPSSSMRSAASKQSFRNRNWRPSKI